MAEKKTKRQKGPKSLPDVRVGDVWQDNDPRMAGTGRELRVKRLSDSGETVFVLEEATGRRNAIVRKRFKPTSTGYKLVERDGKKVS